MYGVGTSAGLIAYQSTLQMQVAGGLLADAVGIRAVYVAAGSLLLAAAGVGWRFDKPN